MTRDTSYVIQLRPRYADGKSLQNPNVRSTEALVTRSRIVEEEIFG